MGYSTDKYSSAFSDPQGPGDSRPTAAQIIRDEMLTSNSLAGHVFLITGCSSGIGVETARAVASTGATVYATARNIPRAEKALGDFLEPGRVEIIEMDLTSLASVRAGAAEFLKRSAGRCNALVCNAGIMAVPTLERTVDGFESQFGVNHLSHFLLFNLIKDAMLKSATEESCARVVVVSSSGHRNGVDSGKFGIRFGNFSFDAPGGEEYTPWGGYGQSKTANIYMANYIDRHFGPQGIHANSLMPGGIMTSLQKHLSSDMIKVWASNPDVVKGTSSTQQGAATTVWAAVGRDWEGKGGKYLEACGVAEEDTEERYKEAKGAWGFAKHAYDPGMEDRLWVESEKMVGLA
jgi:NAD(P)-dependent dehydrogenase (short-subunit alcohol dehydrogenase family)